MGLVLGEDFGKVLVFFGNWRKVVLCRFIGSGKVFGEAEDSVEMQEVDFIIGVDFCRETYFRRDTWRLRKRK